MDMECSASLTGTILLLLLDSYSYWPGDQGCTDFDADVVPFHALTAADAADRDLPTSARDEARRGETIGGHLPAEPRPESFLPGKERGRGGRDQVRNLATRTADPGRDLRPGPVRRTCSRYIHCISSSDWYGSRTHHCIERTDPSEDPRWRPKASRTVRLGIASAPGLSHAPRTTARKDRGET